MTTAAGTEAQLAGREALIGRRWMVMAGSALMAAVMLIGAFSIGVWVGSGRSDNPAVLGGPRFPGPGGGRGQTGQPPTGQPGLAGRGGQAAIGSLSRAPDLVGRIESFSGGTLTIDTPDGPRLVRLDGETQVFLQDGGEGSVDDLGRGRTVALVGRPGADGRTFLVDEAAMLPGR